VHNAHPHFSHGPKASVETARPRIALVHNGIIENHEELRAQLQARGYVFQSQTDTEVIVHLIDSLYDGDLFEALKAAASQLHGARTNRKGWWARAPARPWCWAWAKAASIFWPATPWPWPA
jgi:glucosamine 6-phosphate synthetase-like amidotransferase/phosphosugar isomerase protein